MIRMARVGTGGVVAVVVLGVIALDWFTGTEWGTAALFTVGSCVALRELCSLLRGGGIETYSRWAVVSLAAAMTARVTASRAGLSEGEARELSLGILALGLTGPLMWEVARARTEVQVQPDTIRRAGATCLALGYVGFLTMFLLELRLLRGDEGLRTGLKLALLLLACVKVGDTMAYFVGRTVGRRPMCPVSPKKTWEGSVASVIGSVVTALTLGHIGFGFGVEVMIGFGIVADLAGQGGDLVESFVKRALGAKDSARTFGEMGGVLDMIDALLLAAPPAFLWADLLIVRGG